MTSRGVAGRKSVVHAHGKHPSRKVKAMNTDPAINYSPPQDAKHSPFLLVVVIFMLILTFIGSLFFFSRKPKTEISIELPAGITPKPTIPKDIKIPEPNESSSEKGLAIPLSSRDALDGSVSKYRTFNITAKNNAFSVNKIIVNQYDIVSIQFLSEDNTYDFTIPEYNVTQKTASGEIKKVEFQAVNDGYFKFVCLSCSSSANPFANTQPE